MDLVYVFYVSVYFLAGMAGAILSGAEGVVSPVLGVIPCAVVGLIFNERFRTLRLGVWPVNTLGFLSFVYCGIEFVFGNEEARLLAGAHLLAFLQCILLLMRKVAYQYWWICALSLLQLAIASVLTQLPWFGLCILIYMFWAVWTLSLYTQVLARLRFGVGEKDNPEKPRDWAWPMLIDVVAVTANSPHKERWVAESQVRNNIDELPGEQGVNFRFIRAIGGLSFFAIIMGLIVFIFSPRLWVGGVNPFRDVIEPLARPVTGFTDKLQLGDFGKVLENPTPVMELRVFHQETDAPVNIAELAVEVGQDVPLIRGTVLSDYNNGEWTSTQKDRLRSQQFYSPSVPSTRLLKTIKYRQEIHLQPLGSRVLFTWLPAGWATLDDHASPIDLRYSTQTLTYSARPFLDGLDYKLYSQASVVTKPLHFQYRRPQYSQPLELFTEVPEGLSRLRQLARSMAEAIDTQKAPLQATDKELAYALESHFAESGKYEYTLNLSITDPNIDPVEDFLFNRAAGHCQYFATALALMLRSLEIPARVVTGFKGGVISEDGLSLEVQQRHAHAWVEAYLDGEWTTLDPTPGAREAAVEEIGKDVYWYHRVMNWFNEIWQDYVVNLSLSRQQKELYAPFQKLGQSLWEGSKDFRSDGLGSVKRLLASLTNPREWFSVQGGLFALMLGLVVVGSYYLARWSWALLNGGLGPGRVTARQGRQVEFYERLLALLAKWNMKPERSQTQQEFAQEVHQKFITEPGLNSVAEFPEDFASEFYRVRFGDFQLTDAELSRMEQLLKRLEEVFHNKEANAHTKRISS